MWFGECCSFSESPGGSALWEAVKGVKSADLPGAKSQPFKIEPCSLSSDKYVW